LADNKLLNNKKNYDNKLYSEGKSNSIICDSESQNIENFTLGPEQFANINVNNKPKAVARNLFEDFWKEDQRMKNSDARTKRRNIGKYPSADSRLSVQGNILLNDTMQNEIVIKNHNLKVKQFDFDVNQYNILKQSQVFVPVFGWWRNINMDVEHKNLCNDILNSDSSSLKSNAKRFYVPKETNLNLYNSMKGKTLNPNRSQCSQLLSPIKIACQKWGCKPSTHWLWSNNNKASIYFDKSDSSHVTNNAGTKMIKNCNTKLPEYKPNRSKNRSNLFKMQLKIIRNSSNPKIPKDFF